MPETPTAPTSGEPPRTLPSEPDDSSPSEIGESPLGYTPLNFSGSERPSTTSTRRFPLPRNVHEFAGQASKVANMVLNGEIDLDTARAYSAVARTVAQAVTAETTRSRILREVPDLDLPNMEDDEG